MAGAQNRAFELTTELRKVLEAQADRRAWFLQNNNATANIYISTSGSSSQEACLRIAPSNGFSEDVVPPEGELWAMSDTAGVYLSALLRHG